MIPHNPIRKKIDQLIERGTTKEKICVLAEVRYPTLQNIYHRNRVSRYLMVSLERAGIIDDMDVMEYKKWERIYKKGKPNDNKAA